MKLACFLFAFALAGAQPALAQETRSELRLPDGTVYTGTLKNGVPDGSGYFRYHDGNQYEGGVRMGQPWGAGEMLYANGDDYKGEWKNGKHDGIGAITYTLGGRYEGAWKDDAWSGQGKLVYAGGTGREVTTVDGRDPNRDAAPETDKTYSLKEESARTGTRLKRDLAIGSPVPPDRDYERLSLAQQASINAQYPALAPGDEPPYPRGGPAEFYRAMATIVGRTSQEGNISVYVTVGKDGKAVSVRALGLDNPEVRKLIATAAGIVQYKPARCAGQPCEMAYAFRMKLELALD